jgi:DNA-directed RNA polymerase sigma subunit (sigma70/sigma32)
MIDRSARADGAPAGSDSLAQYLREIGRRPLLTPAEEVALAKRIEEGDVAAKHRMVESNLRLVVAIARRYASRGVPLRAWANDVPTVLEVPIAADVAPLV